VLSVLYRVVGAGIALCVCLSALGCASHSDKTKSARSALDAGRAEEALRLFNKELGVENAEELPAKVEGEAALLILDRAMVLQQLEKYELSSRDLQTADKAIEMLDFSRGTVDEIGKYLFSDDTGPYRAPFYEKLLINTINMLNYLQRGELNGARIEARRLTVMQAYIKDHEGEGAELTGPGSYLAGFTFEKSGDAQEALRYYDEALQFGRFPSLGPVLVRLAEQASYRTPRIESALEAAQGAEPLGEGWGEVLIVVNQGRVPAKVAKRIPIGLALTYASGLISPNDHARANELAAQGLVTWVNYPELAKSKKYPQARLTVNEKEQPLEEALQVDREANKAWDSARGTLVASAITRMIARVIAGKTTEKVAGGGVLGAVLSLGTQATLTATDIPDTRSWSTLPARILVTRVPLPPGDHTSALATGPARRRVKVHLDPGGWSVVTLTDLR
jgi:hypothetical protein